MTNPQDPESEDPNPSPYAPPPQGGEAAAPPPPDPGPPPPYSPPPAYGQPPPPYGQQPPPYGQPPYGQQPPPYGQQPPPYGQPPYGAPPPYGQPPMGAMRQGTNGFAIASIVCAFLCSPLGLVFGIIARSQINRTGQGGAGLATAGIVVSIALIALNIALAVSGHALVHLNQGSTG